MKRPQNKFHANTLSHSQVIRSMHWSFRLRVAWIWMECNL